MVLIEIQGMTHIFSRLNRNFDLNKMFGCLFSELDRVFGMLWKLELMHSLVVKVNMSNNATELYTYFPYDNHQCGRIYEPKNVVQLGVFDYTKIGMPGSKIS